MYIGRSTFPAVKNVQRGRAWIDYSKNNNSVSISSVNTSKFIPIFSFQGNMFISTSRNSGSDAYSGGIVGGELMSSEIIFRRGCQNYNGPDIYWQVIEFY
jgi:hypothetical protein